MGSRYSLSRTLSPRPTYRVIDHTFDDEIARYPDTLPNGSPHPRGGGPRSIITSPSSSYRVQDEGRARSWGEVGGYTAGIVERVPAWASAPLNAVLRETPTAVDGIPEDLLDHEGLTVRPWFVVPTSWDDVPAERRLTHASSLHPHQQPRWQDRYAVAIAHGSSTSRLLDVLNRRDAS